MKTVHMVILCACASIATGEGLPFLGIWTNTVNQGRMTVNVAHDFRANSSVIVSATAFSNSPYVVNYTGKFDVVGNDIVVYGESGHGFSTHQVPRHVTTNYFIYSAEKDLLFNKGDANFMHPLGRLTRTASNQVANEIVATALANTTSYLVVDLARRDPNQSADFWRRFPEVIPQDIPAGYLAAGSFLFKKERVFQGKKPLPTNTIMDLVRIHQPGKEWPVCRCFTYYVMAVVLLNSKGNVEAVMMFDIHHDSFSFDDVKGNSFRFRFGSSDTHTKELIKAFDPEKN